MPKHAVMLNHHHHAANLNDGMMPPGLLIQKVSFFARCLNVAPQHKSPQDKVGGQRNNNPECQRSCGNQSADDVGFHDFPPLSMAARRFTTSINDSSASHRQSAMPRRSPSKSFMSRRIRATFCNAASTSSGTTGAGCA